MKRECHSQHVERLTVLALAAAAHACGLELRDLLGHLLGLLGRHRLVDDAQELLLVCVDQRQQLWVLLAQLLQQRYRMCFSMHRPSTRAMLAISRAMCGQRTSPAAAYIRIVY
jgi:hypothetical protein